MLLAPVSDGEPSASEGARRAAAGRGWTALLTCVCRAAADPDARSAPDAYALDAATSEAAATNAAIQNAELRRTAFLIAGDLSATRHDRPPPAVRLLDGAWFLFPLT